MPRTAEPVVLTPGTQSKTYQISKLKGHDLSEPISFTASWEVPSADQIKNALDNPETRDAILTEIVTARRDAAVASARADAISANEPIEIRKEKFIAMARKMLPGRDDAFYQAQADKFFA